MSLRLSIISLCSARFLATGHIDVSSPANVRVPTLVLSILFTSAWVGNSQGGVVQTLSLSTWHRLACGLLCSSCLMGREAMWAEQPTRLWLGALGISYPSKAGRDEVSGRRNWHKLNACYWTGIRNNNRTQYLQYLCKCAKRQVFWNYNWCGERPWCPFTVQDVSQHTLWARVRLVWTVRQVLALVSKCVQIKEKSR